MSAKIIVTEADYGYGNCDSCGHSGYVNVHVHDSITELLKYPEFKQQLIQAGWIPLQEVKTLADKAVLENKFFVGNANYGFLRQVDLANLDSVTVNCIANKGMIFQKVNPKSVLPPEQYKVVAAAIKRNENFEKGREAAKKKRAENSKARKLAKARKLLEDAGQLPNSDEEMMGT